MGLFDDLLGGGQKTTTTEATPTVDIQTMTPSVDPMLVMEEQTTSTPAPVDDILNMSAGNVTPDMPSYTERKAAERASMDASAVLISETPTLLGETVLADSIAPAEEAIPLATMTPVMPVAEANATLTPDIVVQPEVVSTLPEPEVTPVVEMSSPVMTEAVIASTPELVADAGDASLFSEAPVVNMDAMTPAVWVTETPAAEMLVTDTPTAEESTAGDVLSFGADLHTEVSVARADANIPTDTASFLVAGLAQLEAMEVSLAEKKQAFLDQAEQYRQEKERFAELERTALADSRSVDDEQSRIKAMKSYFQNQQKKQSEGSELTESVSTALTGMSVQNAVGNTIEKKSRKAPAKKQTV